MKTILLRSVILMIFACGLTFAFHGKLQVGSETERNQRTIVIRVDGVDFRLKKDVVEKTKATKPPFKPDVVVSLVHNYRLDQKSKMNPQLVFGPEEIRNWKNKDLDRETLRLEFAARRLILDAANDQMVRIRDHDMLSNAARAVIPYLQVSAESGSPSPTPTPEIAGLICGAKPDDTSAILVGMAWGALEANKGGMDRKNFEKALACAKVTIERFSRDADEQQAARLQANECKKTPKATDKVAYFASDWALSDVSAAWFIRGQVFEQQSNCQAAREAYQTIIAKYNCAYIWDPRGWFWNAARGADEGLKRLPAKCT